MQTTVQEIITKVDCMQNIITRMEDGLSVDNYMDYIRTMLEEYVDVLCDAKVKI